MPQAKTRFGPSAFFGPAIPGALGNCGDAPALFCCSLWEETTMCWKISRHGHDPRQVDLLAIIALLVVVVAAYSYLSRKPEPPNTTALIVPSQSVRW